MNKPLTLTLLGLLGLTICSAVISNTAERFVAIGIISLAVLKFIGVSFYFMELKHANAFWKGSILLFLAGIATVLLILI